MSKRPETDAASIEVQLKVAREVSDRRREALRQLAVAEKIMDRDRHLLGKLAKK